MHTEETIINLTKQASNLDLQSTIVSCLFSINQKGREYLSGNLRDELQCPSEQSSPRRPEGAGWTRDGQVGKGPAPSRSPGTTASHRLAACGALKPHRDRTPADTGPSPPVPAPPGSRCGMCLGNLCPGAAGAGVYTAGPRGPERGSPPSPQAPQRVAPCAGAVPAPSPRAAPALTSAPSGPAARQALAPLSFCARSPRAGWHLHSLGSREFNTERAPVLRVCIDRLHEIRFDQAENLYSHT
ncbi:basic proline-rich protein-like [Calypte anna]|uniref:basic proline-rich protein-like n=1 Tax=Calypte anna TaxID=9244 RepID=UPI0011C41417|nr:basic proline-rich protein-like [Calypte anna]